MLIVCQTCSIFKSIQILFKLLSHYSERDLMRKILILSILLFACYSCGKKTVTYEEQVLINKIQTAENLKVFYGSMTNLTVEVIYETGAAPYTGKNLRDKHYWQILEDNLDAIFKARNQNVTLSVPKELSQMKEIASQNKATWTAEEIVSLASNHGNPQSSGTSGRFVAVFINGNFKNGDDVAPSVIGLNVTGTTIIAIFKDVVKSMSDLQGEQVAKFGEQSTLVHELGHALGVVNSGVPATSDHHDHENGAHCTNPQCVMYWQNEGGKDFLDFLRRIISSGDTVLYGSECIDDFKAYRP